MAFSRQYTQGIYGYCSGAKTPSGMEQNTNRLIKIHRQFAAAVQRVIPEAFYRTALVTLAHMCGRFDVTFTVVSGEQHVVAELLVCDCSDALDGGAEIRRILRGGNTMSLHDDSLWQSRTMGQFMTNTISRPRKREKLQLIPRLSRGWNN